MEGRQSYFSRKHAFVLLGISLCIGGFFYFYQKGRAPVDPGYEISLPKGVEVVEDASGVRVVNRVDGYELKVQKSKLKEIEYQKGVLSIQEQPVFDKQVEGEEYIPQYTINATNNLGSLEEFVAEWLGEVEFKEDYEVNREVIGGLVGYTIVPPTFGLSEEIFITKIGGKILIIDAFFIDVKTLITDLHFI